MYGFTFQRPSTVRQAASLLATTGQDRLITPEEVASSVLALCMEDAGGVTGQAILLRGGVRTP